MKQLLVEGFLDIEWVMHLLHSVTFGRLFDSQLSSSAGGSDWRLEWYSPQWSNTCRKATAIPGVLQLLQENFSPCKRAILYLPQCFQWACTPKELFNFMLLKLPIGIKKINMFTLYVKPEILMVSLLTHCFLVLLLVYLKKKFMILATQSFSS